MRGRKDARTSEQRVGQRSGTRKDVGVRVTADSLPGRLGKGVKKPPGGGFLGQSTVYGRLRANKLRF